MVTVPIRLAGIVLVGLLAGCSTLGALGDAGTVLDAYELRAPADGPVAAGAPRPIDLVVDLPVAGGAINTDRILIRPAPAQVQYLPDARWIEPVPEMLQSALVAGLERSGGFRFVGRRPLGAIGDVTLVSSLTEFEAALVPGGAGAEVRVRFTARLVRDEDATVLRTQTFEASAAAPDTGTASLVDAYDRATASVLRQALDWVLRAQGVRPRQT